PVEEVASELVDAATEPEKAEEMIDYVMEGQDDGTDIAAEAEAIQSRVSGWVFEIPSYKYSNLTKTMEDLLKPLETEEGSVE
ncbi:MAG: hypothetical protein QNJ40_26065, partial [Xanthomonadales bacterium]|nr:hypothetical protein [Xanthomonadales bacterium]